MDPAPARFPPVTAACAASMACVIVSGIYLAAHLPHVPPLGIPTGFVVAAGLLFATAAALVARQRGFAWGRFATVARYGLSAYLVITGLLAYVFIDDGTSGRTLALLIASLALFALDVPLILAFTVARYHQPDPGAAR